MRPHATPIRPTPRHAEGRVRAALLDTRIVALVGPRQSGKTTLARKIAADLGLEFHSLDDAETRAFALDDPRGFVRRLEHVVLDEVQRAPELILELKRAVDEDSRPGRFLITGSVDLFRSAIAVDSLAGRVETIELLPFSQSELELRSESQFLPRAFARNFPSQSDTGQTARLLERIVGGGYPEALKRANPTRRAAWHAAYARSLLERDVIDLAAVTKTAELSRLFEHLTLASGQLVNLSAFAKPIGVDSKTIDRWLTLLEQLYLVRRVRAWHRNELKRLVKTPKLHFLDSGLLTALQGFGVAELRANRKLLGPVLEGFVYTELVKQLPNLQGRASISHYRDKDQVEVDFVIEAGRKVIGIEVKAAATLRPEDLKGLERLQRATGDAFTAGIVLHDGERIQRLRERIYAMPFDQLWDES